MVVVFADESTGWAALGLELKLASGAADVPVPSSGAALAAEVLGTSGSGVALEASGATLVISLVEVVAVEVAGDSLPLLLLLLLLSVSD